LRDEQSARRPLVWVRQDFTEIESGALSMSGWPNSASIRGLLVTVRAVDVDTALRTAADALACDAIGSVVLEVWGEARPLDLVASRKLTLAAQMSGVTAFVAAGGAEPQPSTAETRWIVRAAHFAAGRIRMGRAVVRRAACPQPSWPCWAVVIMEWEK